jgi:SPP1 gp7 family putative phage head morphogenesis protein
MARRSWSITGRGQPSPVGYLSAVDRWRAARDEWVMRVREQSSSASEAIGRLTEIADRLPPPPDVEAILRASRAATQTAVRASRVGMIRAGASPVALARVVGVSAIDDDALGTIDAATISEWATEGAHLIRQLAGAEVDELAARISLGVRRGDRWETIAQEMEASGRYMRSRARLIAQDQTARLNGRLTQSLQSAAGVERYWWRTSRDGSVRQSHRAVADQLWTWAEGAPGVGFYGESSHPGQAGRCRCTAEPELPAWLRGSAPAPRRIRSAA